MWCKHLWNSFVYCASFPHHNNAAVHCCMIYLSATSIVFAVFIGKHPRWDNYSRWRQSAIWFISTSENYPFGRRHFPARATYCAAKKGYFVFSLFLFSLLSFPQKHLTIAYKMCQFPYKSSPAILRSMISALFICNCAISMCSSKILS